MHNRQAGVSGIYVILGLLLAAVLGIGAWIWYQNWQDDLAAIASFEECLAAGYQVIETEPRQCTTPDGRAFIEGASEEVPLAEFTEYTTAGGEVIRLRTPQEGEVITSPLEISGEVPGIWSFEGDFPIALLDSDRQAVAEGFATLQGDWMTDEFVPFEAMLQFTLGTSNGEGYLVLTRDNPTDDPDLNDFLELNVRF